jgi:hypothetical protein
MKRIIQVEFGGEGEVIYCLCSEHPASPPKNTLANNSKGVQKSTFGSQKPVVGGYVGGHVFQKP